MNECIKLRSWGKWLNELSTKIHTGIFVNIATTELEVKQTTETIASLATWKTETKLFGSIVKKDLITLLVPLCNCNIEFLFYFFAFLFPIYVLGLWLAQCLEMGVSLIYLI